MELKEKEYTDFDLMVREMRDFLLENKGEIVAEGFPLERKHAYCHKPTEQIFSIKFKYLTESTENINPKWKSYLICNALKTQEGRAALCVAINNIESLKLMEGNQ